MIMMMMMMMCSQMFIEFLLNTKWIFFLIQANKQTPRDISFVMDLKCKCNQSAKRIKCKNKKFF